MTVFAQVVWVPGAVLVQYGVCYEMLTDCKYCVLVQMVEWLDLTMCLVSRLC